MHGVEANIAATGQQILKGVSISVKPGEVHAIMGKNGSGKSTLSKVGATVHAAPGSAPQPRHAAFPAVCEHRQCRCAGPVPCPCSALLTHMLQVLVGHPDYEVSGGSALFKGQNLFELEPEERSHQGLFLR